MTLQIKCKHTKSATQTHVVQVVLLIKQGTQYENTQSATLITQFQLALLILEAFR